MSRKALGTLVSVDVALLLVWIWLPIHRLTLLQLGLGVGLTVTFNLACISRYSGIRFFAPTQPLSILDSSIQESEPALPEGPDDPVSPGHTLLRVLAAFLCVPAALALAMAVRNAKQHGVQAGLPNFARFLIATSVIFWILRRTNNRRKSF